jgi:integrase
MPIRPRNGKLEWRFMVQGQEYSHITDFEDTPRNRTKVQRLEAEAHRLVLDGRAAELRLQVQPFSSGADQFITWARGEYSAHPNTSKRLAVSMTSLKLHFGKRPLSNITAGDIEDFKSLRRAVHKVREVTVRHDLHALSLLFQYGRKHNWCKANVVDEVEIPSDSEAMRMHVLSVAEEAAYFATIDIMRTERTAKKRPVHGLDDLRDLGILMLNQGCRPEELREMEQGAVDLASGFLTIRRGKSKAARRTLRLTAASRSILAKRLQSPGPWVFPSHRVPGAHIGNVQRIHGLVLKKAKLQFVPYDLRHTAATRWAESGTDIATIAAWLGHANLRSVQKYIHPSREHLNAQAEKFEQMWAAREKQPKEKTRLQ